MYSIDRKSSSSDEDLLDESEELGGAHRKKHFLDYDYGDEEQGGGGGGGKINSTHVMAKPSNDFSTNVNNINNNRPTAAVLTTINNNNQLDCRKKLINDRPTTSKMASMADQLNSNAALLNVNKNSSANNNNNNNSNNSNNVETVYSIFSMLGSYNSSDITSKFLEFSKNREMCATLRQSGCISLLVQIIHSEPSDEIRQKQCLQTLHNIIHCNADDKAGRREARVIKLIEQLFDYCDTLRLILRNELSDNIDRHPIQAIGTLMKISFDEEHRHAMCQLGALQTISTLIQLDFLVHGSTTSDSSCITMRRYAGMCLTNLTFGDGNNKALLCSNKNFMKALVEQINCSSDELVQVTASVIRNLSWRADANMKEALNEIETVKILTLAAMKCTQENTLKAILSALWNLSNHCAKNKAEICDIDGAIEFLIDMLSYDAPSKTMAVIENAGGILRNISTHMSLYEKYRIILRQKNCFTILLQQLKSPSLTVVSNACGTLGNLSAHSVEDQKFLRDNGAIPMLRSLIYSKHKMISTGSTVALRHLLACKANVAHGENLDSVAKMMDLKELPTLNVRKQRALEQELNLTADKLDETSPSTKDDKIRDFETVSKINNNKSGNNNNHNKNTQKSEMRVVQDIEDEEAPTNFSKFDNDEQEEEEEGPAEKCEYQESDQITDYSIRYGENQDLEEDETTKRRNILSADDTTKCYNTEGTPATISKAGSMSDLRKEKLLKEVTTKTTDAKKAQAISGIQSPEKTVNYCVEGTPGNFSRNDSLSDLEEGESSSTKIHTTINKNTQNKSAIASKIPPPLAINNKKESVGEKESIAATPKSVTFVNLADETPLMFSRTSSMGSLSSLPACIDDKSSVVSDFSRLASGIMSPSELPDSPTQSVPQSPSSRSHPKVTPRNIPVIKTPLPATREIIGAEAAEDSTNTFNVENTPAVFSSRTSLSNLSFDDEPKISTDNISKDFHLMKHPSEDEDSKVKKIVASESFAQDVTADHSDVESSDDNIILESCINMGINRVIKQKDTANNGVRPETSGTSSINDTAPKIPTQILKENPMDMMRSTSLLPPYLPVVDETNRFIVEDSPCNFSVMSGLSAITIESNMNAVQKQLQNNKSPTKPDLKHQTNQAAGTSSNNQPSQLRGEYDDSLSSLSIESEDDANLLSQAIAAGVQKPKKQDSHPINIPMKPKSSNDVANDSISSVDSCDKDDATNSILEQCIRSGINKVVKKDSAKNRPLMTSSPKKSLLPQPNVRVNSNNNNNNNNKKTDKNQALKDEELLKECIATGMMKTARPETVLVENFSKLSMTDPKNGETTSVIVSTDIQDVQYAVTGVEIDTERNNLKTYSKEIHHDQDESIASESEHSLQAIWMMQNGSSNYDLSVSEDNILERSNEYPANKLSMLACVDIEDESIMDVSNEFLIENDKMSEAKIEDKHKNPDLMLKSVDRLTQELVSTAEYLRKNAITADDISEQKMSSSISNNTWNDEVSFPSISMTAPMIGSTNDEATFATDQINPLPEETNEEQNGLDLMNDKTPTNEQYVFNVIKSTEDSYDGPSPKLDFKVGGEIASQSLSSSNKINFLSCGPASIDTLSSTMSNSTIVQVEAKRIANKLINNSKMMDSTTSLDLENIRPPSSMDSISLCSFQDLSIQQSPLKQSHAKKSLITGLVAKRALGHQVFGGSVESVNSINNIDSIRPPSLMDELLDSMISVDSIMSEVVDPTFGISNYETALSDMEDSLTLRSCQDLSKDETLTPISSDFSSVESTPKKKKSIRAGTPKAKRQSEKDRYKTYTIAVDMLLKEQQQEMQNSMTESGRRSSLNARQRRQEDRQRFETQVINHSSPESPSPSVLRRKDDPERYKTFNIDNEDDCSIRAMTANFEFIRTEPLKTASNMNIFDANGIRDKLNSIKSNGSISSNSPIPVNSKNSDESLDYEHQTSETESQRDLKNVANVIDDVLNVDDIKVTVDEPKTTVAPQKSTKSSYISPYRMTTKVTPTKSKSVRITKTPIIAKVVTTKNSCLEMKSTNIISPKSNISNGKFNGNKSRFGVIPKASNLKGNASKQENMKIEEQSATAPIIRQGTFVKDEPTNENVPVVDVEPVKQQSKLKPPTRLSSTSKNSSLDSKNSSPKRTSNLPSSVTQLKYRSNSNASMKTKENSMLPMRSNTGISLNNPKKNVSSKIAGIWKNNDKRSSSSTQLNGGSKLSTPTGNVNRKIVNSPTKETRIKRSSTCEEIA